MVRRHKKKKLKKLGSRRFGHGNIKNRRGSGNRGGFGRAGRWKHKWTLVTAHEMDQLGKHGFYRRKKRMVTLNIYDIVNMVRNNELEKEGDYYKLSFEGKLLGTGKIDFPVIVEAKAASQKAIEKIEKVGGKVIISDREAS
ncbi:MAG: 50S ribosomal protein L15 [Candidatus Micrarchaeota archaeon]|nr:50S ribosomal protein L15 [Candidatus Micrarchaeota archaeon]